MLGSLNVMYAFLLSKSIIIQKKNLSANPSEGQTVWNEIIDPDFVQPNILEQTVSSRRKKVATYGDNVYEDNLSKDLAASINHLITYHHITSPD